MQAEIGKWGNVKNHMMKKVETMVRSSEKNPRVWREDIGWKKSVRSVGLKCTANTVHNDVKNDKKPAYR